MSQPLTPPKGSTLNPAGANTGDSPSKFQRATAGAGAAISSIASWGPVEKARKSSYLGYATFPFKATLSILGKNWTRLSETIWGPRKARSDMIAVEIPGTFWGSSTKMERIERALRHGWATYAQVKQQGHTDDDIKANGWTLIDIPGGWVTSAKKTTVKKEIEEKRLTPQDAIAQKYITEDQAKIQGWVLITVDVPRMWPLSPIPTEMLLREAIEKEYITVEDAVIHGHFTQEHAEAATWIQK